MKKFELNTSYDFEVKNVVEANGSVTFEVEIGGNLFPVKAYPEQLIGGVAPKNISCQIKLDKNHNAYLVQNESFLYPYLYKPGHGYLFEIVKIGDSCVSLVDKHGLYHAMDKDDTKYSLSELIVRCVEIVDDSNGKAHLRFMYVEPDIDEHKESHSAVLQDSIPPVDVSPVLVNNTHVSRQKSNERLSIFSLLIDRDWGGLKAYLDENLVFKYKTTKILVETSVAIEKLDSASHYWESVRFLVKYDAHLFLSTLAKVDKTRISDVSENTDCAILNDIVIEVFKVTDKLRHAINLLRMYKLNFTVKQKNYILSQCAQLSNPDAFYDLFKLLHLSPDEAVVYLLSCDDNMAAAFILYKFFMDSKNKNLLSEESRYISFKPSKIAEYIQLMENMKSYSFQIAANLIASNVLFCQKSPSELFREVSTHGYVGFKSYLIRARDERKAKENERILKTLSRGKMFSGLIFFKETDRYYVLRSEQLKVYAFLDKTLTKYVPSEGVKIQAQIIKVIKLEKQKFFFVSQIKLPRMYVYPSLFDDTSLLEIAFKPIGGGKWKPVAKQFRELLFIELDSISQNFDYKLKYKAQIVGKKNFFTYIVRIV